MVSVVGVFAVTTAPLAVALSTSLMLYTSGHHRMPSIVAFVVWILQLVRTLSHSVLYGVCNTMFERCMLRMLRCQGPLRQQRHAGQGRARLRASSARPRPGSGNPMAGEVDQNEEVSTIAPLPLGNCHCPLCPQCNGVQVQQTTNSCGQQQSTSATPTISHSQSSSDNPTTAAPPAVRHGCKLSSCSHCSLGGRYSCPVYSSTRQLPCPLAFFRGLRTGILFAVFCPISPSVHLSGLCSYCLQFGLQVGYSSVSHSSCPLAFFSVV